MRHDTAATLKALRSAQGWSLRRLAAQVPCSYTTVWEIETGRKPGSAEMLARLDEVLGARGALAALAEPGDPSAYEAEAAELVARVRASDVSSETFNRLQQAVDELAISYTTSQPALLLPRIRQQLALVARLVEARKTLLQQRQLFVLGGWLSLLAATVHIDLRQGQAATARLAVAEQLAGNAGHPEIEAWCWETRAWEVLTAGDFRQAVSLSQRAQAVAPAGSSARIQATAQEGRAWARMHRRVETHDALDRVSRLTSPLQTPDQPEHHYWYDPGKARSYTATTLAWAGDPAAEGVAYRWRSRWSRPAPPPHPPSR